MTKSNSLNNPSHQLALYGHRGASAIAPENTAAAIKEAFLLEAAGVEFDLQMTLDLQVILLHDETLERTAQDSLPQKLKQAQVKALTLAEVQQADVGLWKNERWRGERIITFEQALELLPTGKRYLIEVKGDDLAIIPQVQHILSKPKWRAISSQLTLIGFGLQVMEQLKKSLPYIENFLIFDFLFDEAAFTNFYQQAITTTKQAGLDGIDFRAERSVSKQVVDAAKMAGLKVAVWVPGGASDLDTAENFQLMQKNGVDIFTSNLPVALTQLLAQHYPR